MEIEPITSRGYENTEDEVANLSVSATISSDFLAQTAQATMPLLVSVYGPGCWGCESHSKAMMISYRLDGNEHRSEFGYQIMYNVFVTASDAEKLLNLIDNILPKQAERGLTLQFERKLAGDTVTLRLNAQHAETFLDDVSRNTKEIRKYIERRRQDPRPDPLPERKKPLSAEQNAKIDEYLASCYYIEPRDIPIGDIDPGLLLAALYNNSQTGGMGLGHYLEAIMYPAEGTHILREVARVGARYEFDDINGRSIKTHLIEVDGSWFVEFSRFGDYNGLPIVAVIEAARAGHYDRLSGQGILDIEAEATLLLDSVLTNPNDKATTLNALHQEVARRLSQEADEYILNQRQYIRRYPYFKTAKKYQISVCGSKGEIGHLISPYNPVNLVDLSLYRR